MTFVRGIALLMGLFLLASTPNSQPVAQEQSPTAESGVQVRIAIIDIEAIEREALAMKDIQSQLRSLRGELQKWIQDEQQQISEAREGLARQRALLAPEVFAEERREFEQRVVASQEQFQRRQRDIDRAVNQAVLKVRNALDGVVTDIAQDFQLTLIINKSATVMVATPLDATGEALKRLDERLDSVAVADPDSLPPPSNN